MNSMYYHRVIGFLINVQVQEQHPHPLPRSWQLREWQISYQLSWYAYHESFHSLQSLSVSCFQVILGLPGPRFPSTCMSKAVLTAPLECSTCPYQWSLLSFRIRSRSSMSSRASSSLDLVVTMSCDFTLIDLSHHCPIISLQTLEVWLCQWPSLTGMEHYLPHTRPVHAATCSERQVAGRENW